MSRLLVWASILGSLLVVAAFVPLRGRTVAERWRAAPSAIAFVEDGVKEIGDGVSRLLGDEAMRAPPHASQRSASAWRASGRAGAAPAKAPPAVQERHSAADRSALDRIVAERSGSSR